MVDLSKLLLNSLYKFLCLIGLLSTAFFIATPEYLEYSWRAKQVEHLMFKADALKQQQESLSEYENYKREMDIYEAILTSETLAADPKEKQEVAMQVIESSRKHFSSNKSGDYKGLVADIKEMEVIYYKEKLTYIENLRFWGLIISLSVLSLGLVGWYFKIQRPLDIAFEQDPSSFSKNNA